MALIGIFNFYRARRLICVNLWTDIKRQDDASTQAP